MQNTQTFYDFISEKIVINTNHFGSYFDAIVNRLNATGYRIKFITSSKMEVMFIDGLDVILVLFCTSDDNDITIDKIKFNNKVYINNDKFKSISDILKLDPTRKTRK